MSATIVSLLGVTIGFTLLVVWVYWPSRRRKLEELGRIPLDGDDGADAVKDPAARQERKQAEKEQANNE